MSLIMNDHTKEFYINLKTLIQNATLDVNTETQTICPTFRTGLQLTVSVPNIPEPIVFDVESQNTIPPIIWKNIQKNTKCTLVYTIPTSSDKLLKNRSVTFIVAIQEICESKQVQEVNKYIRKCITWLQIAQKNAKQTKCNKDPLLIYLLFSPLIKMLPPIPKSTQKITKPVIGWSNVNSAFSVVCQKSIKKQKVREIVIFRKEEWFKVFIHETFHNYGFDFSAFSPDFIQTGTSFVLTHLYPVKSDVNLYEAYTECWSRIIAIAFSSTNTTTITEPNSYYINCVQKCLNEEITFSFFQAAKVLEYMDVATYERLITGKAKDLYKEHTSILSYYIITLVLFSNYNEFIQWNHTTIRTNETNKTNKSNSLFKLSEYIIFPNTKTTLDSFCKFIYRYYKKKNFINQINQNISNIHNNHTLKRPNTQLLKTMRMTYHL